MVAVALAANIWLPRHLRLKYSWERDLSQRIAADLVRPDTLVTVHTTDSYENAGTPPPSGRVHPRFAAAEYGLSSTATPASADKSCLTESFKGAEEAGLASPGPSHPRLVRGRGPLAERVGGAERSEESGLPEPASDRNVAAEPPELTAQVSESRGSR